MMNTDDLKIKFLMARQIKDLEERLQRQDNQIIELRNASDQPIQAEAYEETFRILTEQILRRNQIIRELMAWIDSEFRLDTYLPGSPGRRIKLWERAREATQ